MTLCFVKYSTFDCNRSLVVDVVDDDAELEAESVVQID